MKPNFHLLVTLEHQRSTTSDFLDNLQYTIKWNSINMR
jgi:hypothetical protein